MGKDSELYCSYQSYSVTSPMLISTAYLFGTNLREKFAGFLISLWCLGYFLLLFSLCVASLAHRPSYLGCSFSHSSAVGGARDCTCFGFSGHDNVWKHNSCG